MARQWDAVASAINTRLAERKMTQKALADESGVSVATLRKLQKGEPGERGRPVLIALSVALGWAAHHLEAIADGAPAPNDPSTHLRRDVETMRADLDEVRDRLAAVEAAQRGNDRSAHG